MAKLVGQPKPANWAKRENWAEGTEEFKLTLPNQTYSDKLTYYDDETPVELIYLGPAHTDGDTLVYLPKQKILFAGDIGVFGVTPLNGSGYVAGLIKTCDKILAMDAETIVPGHGPVGGKPELAEMRDYFVLIQREGKKRFDSGMSISAPYSSNNVMQYRSDISRQVLKMNLGWKVKPKLKHSKQNRYFTVLYNEGGSARALVFDVTPQVMQPYLAEIDLKSGKRVEVQSHEEYYQ